MSWEEISKINPALKKLKSIFKNIPLTPKERENYNKFRKGINDNAFAQLPYEDKKMYLDTVGHQALSSGQFESLPDDLKSHYIGFGLGLDYYKFKKIEDNKPLLKRYKQITERKVDELENNSYISFTVSELEILDEDKKKKAINNLSATILLNIIVAPSASINGDKILEDIAKYKLDMNSNTVYSLLAYCNDPKRIAQILGQDNIDKLQDRNIFHLLNHNDDISKTTMAQILGPNNINKLSDNGVRQLFLDASENTMEEIVNIIMSKGTNLSNGNIFNILQYTHNPTETAEKILEIKGPNLSSSNINNILENKKIDNTNDRLSKKIIQYKGDNLNSDDVFHILTYAYDIKGMANLIGQNNINKLDGELIYSLLVSHMAYRIIEMAQVLGQENINKIPSVDVYHLLRLKNEEDRLAMQKILVNHPAYQEQMTALKRWQPETAKKLEQNIQPPILANRLYSSKFNDNYIGKL